MTASLAARTPTRLRKLLAVALVALAGCYGLGGAGDTVSAVPHPPSLTPMRRLRRLSSREYDNVARDLLGDDTHPSRAFVPDVFTAGYDNGAAGLAVQSDQVAAYRSAAEALAASAVARDLGRLTGGCDPATRGEAACVDGFLGAFAPRAYRRPLAAAEAQRLRDVYAAETAVGGTFARGVQTMLEVVLQSPQLLYREELGPSGATVVPYAPVRLTDYEAASQLSFLLTGTIPDAALWSAVTGGGFTTADDRRREATRLLATPAAKAALGAFLHAWLGTDRLVGLSKDPSFYPTFGAPLAASMKGELDRDYEDAMGTGGSLRRLFTSSQSYADGALSTLYGVPSTSAGADFQPIALDPSARGGVLTRAGFLAVHADTDSSGPIARGVFVLQALMCSPPPPPPPNVPPAPPATDPGARTITTRQRFDRHVASPVCAGCHTTIDGIGFGFEEYDAIGAFRALDNGLPVDASGTVVGTGEIDGPYVGATALGAKLAGSKVLRDCFARQAYRYAMGQVEPAGTDPTSLALGFSSDAQLTDLLLAIVADPLFVTRTFEPQAR